MGFGKTLVELEDWHIALAYRTLFLSMGIVYRVKMCWFWMYTGQALVNSVEFKYPYGFHVYSIFTTVWVWLTVNNNNISASVRGTTNLFNLLTLCLSKWEWEQRQRGSLQARPRSPAFLLSWFSFSRAAYTPPLYDVGEVVYSSTRRIRRSSPHCYAP